MLRRLSERLERLRPGVAEPAAAREGGPPAAVFRADEAGIKPPPELPEEPWEPEYEQPAHALELLRSWQRPETPYGAPYVAREDLPRPPAARCDDIHALLGDQRLEGFRMDRALYLDIEATGLSHGAGTLAFLIGVAWFEEHGLVLEQLLLDDPENEMPVLARFLEILERWPYLVSFNGKSYDLSVLQSRLVVTRLMSRADAELKLHPHLDLLHASRQAYKGVFADCRLQTFEREVLDVPSHERADDIPGSLVPAYYFHFLRTGCAPYLDGILRHNRLDVLSMVALVDHLLRLYSDPPETSPALVLSNLGSAFLRRGLDERAAALLARAVGSGELGVEALRRALCDRVTAERRLLRWDAAAAAAERLLELLQPWEDKERGRLRRQIARYRKKAGSGRIGP